MIPKPTTINPPLDVPKTIQLELMLVRLFSAAAQFKTGTYTGNGVANRSLVLGFKAAIIYIQKTTAGGSNVGAFALREASNATFIPGSGTVAGAVTAWGSEDITLGSNADVNGAGSTFAYFAIG